jgi:hypothetical protein
LPEAPAAWKLLLSLGGPTDWIAPDPHRRSAIAEVYDAGRIQGRCGWQWQAEVLKQASMAATGFQARDLGRAHIKGVGPTAEGAGAATSLVVGLQQVNSEPGLG